MDKKVPFFPNTPDDTHCFQAALRMIVKYFWPDRNFSWEELEKITAKVKGLWTWPMAGMVWLSEHGMEVKNIDAFDYERFINEGGRYLIEEYGEEAGQAQIKHSDIEQERNFAKEFINKIKIENSIPTTEDIKTLLQEGYLVMCNVNSRALNNEKGYTGHFVVIKGYNNTHLFIHDPGLPPAENRRVSYEQFEKGWAHPNEKAKNIMAFRI